MSGRPVVSVVIPCHNAAPWLAQTIGSALDQTCPPREIIVVDDDSTDGSLDVALRAAAAAPEQVRVFSEPSHSGARTRNLGALAATGEALMFLDADDVVAPGTLAALAGALAREPTGVAVCPWFRLERAGDRWIRRPASCAPRLPGQDALIAWLSGWYHPPCSVLWSRAAFERAGRWDERSEVNDDGDLMMRALAADVPFVEASEGAGYYRRLPGGQVTQSGRRFTREGLVARIRTMRKVGYLLEQRGRLGPYRVPLAGALDRIASEARDHHHPDIAREARACAREYGPSLRARVGRRAGRPRAGTRPGDGARDGEHEIRWGLDRAGGILRAAASAPDRRPGVPGPVERPCVSVIVPAYNRAAVLPRAVDSVLAQTFGDLEVLIVDDGSTDDTEAVAGRYADPRVRYLKQDRNRGVSAARNRGIRASRGEFIAFLDSDDEWLPQKLARQIGRFREAPASVGLIYSAIEHVRDDGRTAVECSGATGDVYREMLRANVIHGGGSNVVIRREVVGAVGFFHEGLPAIEDYEYWLRVARFFHVDVVDEPLVRYHDVGGDGRRSRALRANLDARWWFYRTHLAEMRRAGVAHLFLLKSVRRALSAPEPDVRAARRLAARAVYEAPTSRAALAAFGRTIWRRA